METATVQCGDRETREINREIRQRIAEGYKEIEIAAPGARHSLGVAILEPVHLTFNGSVGYYCAGLMDGATATIRGSAGWGLAESMMNGTVIVEGSAGNGAAAAMRGGTVVIQGDASARAGVSMKGGTLLIAGDSGYMTGFMAQKGTIIICGDAGEALADSMYEATVFVGGKIADLGTDAVIHEPTAEDGAFLRETLGAHGLDADRDWKKIVAGRKLWNFDKHESTWREIL
jgi:glutamate synthase domain-containing protein 3